MPKKSIKKRKALAARIHQTVKKGLINLADGSWVNATGWRSAQGTSESGKQMYFAGRKVDG